MDYDNVNPQPSTVNLLSDEDRKKLESERKMKEHGLVFSFSLLVFQVIILGLFAGYTTYDSTYNYRTKANISWVQQHVPSSASKYYTSFQDVHVMIFIGFGFLMTFLKRYGFGAVSYNLLLSCVCIQWATLINAWMHQKISQKQNPDEWQLDATTMKEFSTGGIRIGYTELMTSDFTCASVLITFGALLGKTTRLQLLVVVLFECVFFAINENVLATFVGIRDTGGSIVVHLFGAYFGLGVSWVVKNYADEHPLEGSNYQSDLFSMIGTIFLWVFWPSFNSGTLGDNPQLQQVAIINTYFSLCACVVTTFVLSTLLEKDFKLDMVHIQNATLAGGVAVGTCADLNIQPWGAILIGSVAGFISVIGFNYISPFLCKKLKVHDTCGVHNLHGMPAFLAGVCSAVAAAAIESTVGIYDAVDSGKRTRGEQGLCQLAGIAVSLGIALISGALTGVAIKPLNKPLEEIFDDDPEWLVPEQEAIPDKSITLQNAHATAQV